MLLLLSHEPGQKTATHCTQTGVWHWNTWADKGRRTTDAEQTSKWCPYWREPDQHRCRSNQIRCDDTILWLISFDWWNQMNLISKCFSEWQKVGEVKYTLLEVRLLSQLLGFFFSMKTVQVSNSSFFCHSCNSLIVGQSIKLRVEHWYLLFSEEQVCCCFCCCCCCFVFLFFVLFLFFVFLHRCQSSKGWRCQCYSRQWNRCE